MRSLLITIMALNFAYCSVCEVYNYDDDGCELFSEQNLTLIKEWSEFY